MLRLALLFLVIATVAAVLGYGGIQTAVTDGARPLFFVFLALAVLTFVGNYAKGSPPRDLV